MIHPQRDADIGDDAQPIDRDSQGKGMQVHRLKDVKLVEGVEPLDPKRVNRNDGADVRNERNLRSASKAEVG
jgi:hypothetical protein